jgi:hypothetical protein
VVLVPDEGGDDPIFVNLTDVGTIGNEHLTINTNSNT